MIVRGAPAIGATGAFGLAQAALLFKGDNKRFLDYIKEARKILLETRPTAYDLKDGLDFVFNKIKNENSIKKIKNNAVSAAQKYADDSVERCKKIGEYGNKLIKNNYKILTHCNAGALACVDYGTALAPIRAAHYSNKKIFVFVDETRPRLQGAQLTAFELSEEKIPHAIIADNAAGYYMKKKKIDICIVGADRIALNGDFANKIGTYEKAVLAFENKIPFYIAAPTSTIDLKCSSGDKIPIEERDEEEVHFVQGIDEKNQIKKVRVSPKNSKALNPAFDVTPAKYVTGIITEKGIINANKKEIIKVQCIY
jgi:translation initiation factor eIF-2B subunit alpha/methylthioribose-1-phosphate isomerase